MVKTMNPTLLTIRAKKLGVLIRSARWASGKSLEACASAIGVSASELEAYELGEHAPSLPELEMLAFYLQIPLEYFWGNELFRGNGHPALPDIQQLRELRQRMIGAMLRKARNQAALGLEDAAAKAGLGPEQLKAYELGEQAIPLPELESLAKALTTTISEFQDKNGPVGSWFIQQQMTRDFLDLPQELQAFVTRPINQPYLEVARRLSELQADKLRSMAEILLEITL